MWLKFRILFIENGTTSGPRYRITKTGLALTHYNIFDANLFICLHKFCLWWLCVCLSIYQMIYKKTKKKIVNLKKGWNVGILVRFIKIVFPGTWGKYQVFILILCNMTALFCGTIMMSSSFTNNTPDFACLDQVRQIDRLIDKLIDR